MALAEKTYLFQTDEEKHKHLSLLSTNLQHLRYSGLWPFIIIPLLMIIKGRTSRKSTNLHT